MKLESKYDFNDTVWSIRFGSKQIFTPCDFCSGSGRIEGANKESRACPACYGHKGKSKTVGTEWFILTEGPLTVGQIRVVSNCAFAGYRDMMGVSNYGPQQAKAKVEYMCFETGIGSGSIHYEDLLWPSKEEAQAECDRRNEAGIVPE